MKAHRRDMTFNTSNRGKDAEMSRLIVQALMALVGRAGGTVDIDKTEMRPGTRAFKMITTEKGLTVIVGDGADSPS